MSSDRAATLRRAEKLVRQGKLDQAIAEYLHLVEAQPGDWNTANLLGDLYVRAGQFERAIEQFSRSAESLRHEGFLPRASAIYKKILKLTPESDHALMQAGELAVDQGLISDARTCFTAAATGRRQRGDERGALEAVVRIGHLDMADVEARLASARALLELDRLPAALYEFTDLGLTLVESGRDVDAVVPLREAVALDPANVAVVTELVRILIARGLTSEAATYLTPDLLDGDTGLLLLAVRLRFEHGDTTAGLEMAATLIGREASARTRVLDLALSLADTQPDVACSVVDLVADADIARRDWSAAADAIERLVARAPSHVAALTRLSDLRAALAAGGTPDVERALADVLAAPPSVAANDDPPPDPDMTRNPHAIDLDLIFGRPTAAPAAGVLDEVHPPATPAASAPADIEQVFAQLRDEAANRPSDEAADVAYTRGAAMFEVGELEQAIEPLRTATRSPSRRFAAASLLAGVYQQQGRMSEAIEWLGHAVDAPGVTDAERFATLFTLADLFEQSGAPASALAVCLELQSDAGDYKDLAARVARLSRESGG